MTTVETPAPAKPRSKWGGRSIAALIIFIIATLLTPVAVIGHWGHRTVIDSNVYIATVTPLAEDPALQEALSTAISDAILERIDTKELVSGFLGNLINNDALATQLAGPLSSGIDGIIRGAVARFVASKQFQNLWVALNKAAQRGIVAVLQGGQSGPVRLEGDTVVLNIDSIITAAQKDLVDAGISAAGSIELPKTDREIVLFQSSALPQIQFAYRLASPILEWLPLILAILFGVAILLARKRPRMTFLTGIALVAWAAILGYGMQVAQSGFTNALVGTPFEAAATNFWSALFRYLISGLVTVLVLGAVLMLVSWFAGRTPPGPAIRGPVDRWLNDLGSRIPVAARSFVAKHLLAFRTAAIAIAVAVLSTGDLLSGWHLVLCLGIAALLFAAVEIVREPQTKIAAD